MNLRWVNCNESYDERMKVMVQYVQPSSSILDVGCGKERLALYLPNKCKYQGIDLVKRSLTTIVCDLNHEEYPPLQKYDYVICGGLLEYLNDLPYFLSRIRMYGKNFIFSYAINTSSIPDRQTAGWVNHYDASSFAQLLLAYRYKTVAQSDWRNQIIYHLTT